MYFVVDLPHSFPVGPAKPLVGTTGQHQSDVDGFYVWSLRLDMFE